MAIWNMFKRELHPLLRLSPLLAEYSWQVVLFLVLALLAALTEGIGTTLMIPLLQSDQHTIHMSWIMPWINRLSAVFPAEHKATAIAGLIMAAVLLKAMLAFAYTSLATSIKGQISHQLRTQMFRRLMAVQHKDLDKQQSGVMLQTLSRGAEQTAQSMQTTLWLLFHLCSILVFTVLLMTISWQITLTVVAVLLVLSLVVRLATLGVGDLSQRNQKASQELSQRLKEGIFGLRTIHVFCRENYEDARFAAASEHCNHLATRQEMLILMVYPLAEGLTVVMLIGLVLVALKTGFSLSVLVTMVFMLYRLQPHILQINASLTRLASMEPMVKSAMDMMNSPEVQSSASGTKIFRQLEQGIRFEKVNFTYGQKNRNVLQEVSLEFIKGTTTAIVGPSGAGKSTIINLLTRFYEPTSGRILVDGIDISEFDLASWRGRTALVSQDVHLFNGTIRESIAYGKLDASEEEIVEAATRAHAHKFILKLPKGYDTPVGDNGKRLSGGQRQRLSIARAIVRNPDVLILDEATNALDNFSEAYIQKSIEELGRDRTIIVVAHRLSTIERADNILVMDQGRLVEQGCFEELLAQNGLFSTLYHSGRNEPLSL